MFDGGKSGRVVDMGGRASSSAKDRKALLEKSRRERAGRMLDKQKDKAALTLQKTFRGRLARRAACAQVRKAWDVRVAKWKGISPSSQDLILLPRGESFKPPPNFTKNRCTIQKCVFDYFVSGIFWPSRSQVLVSISNLPVPEKIPRGILWPAAKNLFEHFQNRTQHCVSSFPRPRNKKIEHFLAIRKNMFAIIFWRWAEERR